MNTSKIKCKSLGCTVQLTQMPRELAGTIFCTHAQHKGIRKPRKQGACNANNNSLTGKLPHQQVFITNVITNSIVQ